MSTAVAAQVKERPLIFSGNSVKAILAGIQTQTRRVITPQPEYKSFHRYRGETLLNSGDDNDRLWCWKDLLLENILNAEDRQELAQCCPHGIPGDHIWVKENWAPYCTGLDHKSVHYRCDFPDDKNEALSANHAFGLMRWKSSVFMPRRASRLALEITNVRVQRLQEISEEDAIAEGCESWSLTPEDISDIQISDDSPDMKDLAALLGPGTMPATAEYRMLWDSLNGKTYPWISDPWVWAISFRKITR